MMISHKSLLVSKVLVRSYLLVPDFLNSNGNGRTPMIGDTSAASVTGLF